MVTVTTLTVLGDCTTELQLAGSCSSLTLLLPPLLGELQEPVLVALIWLRMELTLMPAAEPVPALAAAAAAAEAALLLRAALALLLPVSN